MREKEAGGNAKVGLGVGEKMTKLASMRRGPAAGGRAHEAEIRQRRVGRPACRLACACDVHRATDRTDARAETPGDVMGA